MTLSKDEQIRYARHFSLDQIGPEGQNRLKAAKVLVVGAGGLGCPVLQYLTAAGVGTIGIVDGDVVEASNLQRQILFGQNDVGKNKVERAIVRLQDQNPFTRFVAHPMRMDVSNALELAEEYDIVVDGSDNFPTRYLVNDTCVVLNKPLVFGSIFKFSGQVAVFNFQGGPSYRCLYPEPPQEGEVPNCSEIGVLGVLPGLVGTLMATECLKMILGIGEVLSGKLQLLDSLSNQKSLIGFQRNEANFTRTALEPDYDVVCGISNNLPMKSISAVELKQQLDNGEKYHFLDVREPYEFELCSLPGSQLIPLNDIPGRMQEVPKDRPCVVICHHGMRSAHAIVYLEDHGFDQLINLEGGIQTWAEEVDEAMTQY